MDLEEKEFPKRIKDIKVSFGWKVKDFYTRRSGRVGHRTIFRMERDKDMPNYDELVRLEEKYDAYENEKQKYEEMDLEVALVLYLLLLVPGIIYTVHKSKQKKEITEYNKALQQRMDKILEKAKALL